jgi:nucleotide-binding universal stress UspA family protein
VHVTRVVAGTSGSPGSLAALRYAEWLASSHYATLLPVLAWEPPCNDGGGTLQPAGYLYREWHDMARQRMRAALFAVWGREPVDPRTQPQVEQGPAGQVLVGVACRPGDVLVIGAGRRGALRRLAGRRVSRYCAAHALCPVILVPPPALGSDSALRRLTRYLARRTLTAEQIVGDRGQPSAA